MVLKIALCVICGIIFLCVFAYIGVLLEKASFNNCRCIRCGYPLKRFDDNGQGGRRYKCDKCGYTTWVSWNGVDKKYRGDK